MPGTFIGCNPTRLHFGEPALEYPADDLMQYGPGAMPNPTVEQLCADARITRDNNIDLIPAVNGGSVIASTRGVSASA